MFETERRGGVLRYRRPATTWLSTGWRGGKRRADEAYSLTVPKDWRPDDIDAAVDGRLASVGLERDPDAPVLLTGVAAENARGARRGPVEAYATVGLSNPAALPMEPAGGDLPEGELLGGTVNLVVGTTAALADGALANLVAVAAEAKAATLGSAVGYPGTTSDAVVVACDPAGEPREFSGSATRVGAAARACVRDAVLAALDARYEEDEPPASVADAEYGVATEARADVFEP
ncbi:adenosylcobinamide amidohydrolase [Halorarius halobius]|uniref:adenosylcobinamide amidohydrolase n=1 Tax=Halorarius halobius TaxID=2962671 RepID=UPI0020CC47B3|nr:adenosylcobinamide amidohydrolase [Halorarius halobius]